MSKNIKMIKSNEIRKYDHNLQATGDIFYSSVEAEAPHVTLSTK